MLYSLEARAGNKTVLYEVQHAVTKNLHNRTAESARDLEDDDSKSPKLRKKTVRLEIERTDHEDSKHRKLRVDSRQVHSRDLYSKILIQCPSSYFISAYHPCT